MSKTAASSATEITLAGPALLREAEFTAWIGRVDRLMGSAVTSTNGIDPDAALNAFNEGITAADYALQLNALEFAMKAPATYDGAREPLRAIRDLINHCEATFRFESDNEALERAQAAFTTIRALFGDFRPADTLNDTEAMIEPQSALIGAAPEMLTALVKTSANLAGLSRSDDDVFAAMLRRVDGAVAKATGKAG